MELRTKNIIAVVAFGALAIYLIVPKIFEYNNPKQNASSYAPRLMASHNNYDEDDEYDYEDGYRHMPSENEDVDEEEYDYEGRDPVTGKLARETYTEEIELKDIDGFAKRDEKGFIMYETVEFYSDTDKRVPPSAPTISELYKKIQRLEAKIAEKES